jgi:hypothetical protein
LNSQERLQTEWKPGLARIKNRLKTVYVLSVYLYVYTGNLRGRKNGAKARENGMSGIKAGDFIEVRQNHIFNSDFWLPAIVSTVDRTSVRALFTERAGVYAGSLVSLQPQEYGRTWR